MAKKVSTCPVCSKELADHSFSGLVVCMKKTNLAEYKPTKEKVSAYNVANTLGLIDTFGQPGADKEVYAICFHGQKDPIITKHPEHTIFAFMLATMVEEVTDSMPAPTIDSENPPDLEDKHWEKETEEDALGENTPETLEE